MRGGAEPASEYAPMLSVRRVGACAPGMRARRGEEVNSAVHDGHLVIFDEISLRDGYQHTGLVMEPRRVLRQATKCNVKTIALALLDIWQASKAVHGRRRQPAVCM